MGFWVKRSKESSVLPGVSIDDWGSEAQSFSTRPSGLPGLPSQARRMVACQKEADAIRRWAINFFDSLVVSPMVGGLLFAPRGFHVPRTGRTEPVNGHGVAGVLGQKAVREKRRVAWWHLGGTMVSAG